MQGSNGEYAYQTPAERVEIVKHVAKLCGDKKVIIAGSGCECKLVACKSGQDLFVKHRWPLQQKLQCPIFYPHPGQSQFPVIVVKCKDESYNDISLRYMSILRSAGFQLKCLKGNLEVWKFKVWKHDKFKKTGLNIRTHASAKWDQTMCPKE